MKASELIKALEEAIKEHGDLKIGIEDNDPNCVFLLFSNISGITKVSKSPNGRIDYTAGKEGKESVFIID